MDQVFGTELCLELILSFLYHKPYFLFPVLFSWVFFLSLEKRTREEKSNKLFFMKSEERWANRLLQAAVVRGCGKDKACLILHVSKEVNVIWNCSWGCFNLDVRGNFSSYKVIRENGKLDWLARPVQSQSSEIFKKKLDKYLSGWLRSR